MLGSWLSRLTLPAAEPAEVPALRFLSWDDVESEALSVGWVSRDRAEGLPGVGRGVRLVCAVLSQMPAHEVRNLWDPGVPLVVLPTTPVLRDPDPQWHGYSNWMDAAVADMQWHGNAFADKLADPDRLGYPTRLPLIAPDRVRWERSTNPRKPDGWKVYAVYPDPVAGEASGRREIDPADMLHTAVDVRSGRRMGRGILDSYQETLRLMVVVERATFVVMRDGKPAGLLTSDTDMDAEELAAVKAALIAGIRRDGIGAMIRADFKQMSWNANDMALVPAREYNLRLASDMVGITPYLLGVPSESRVYANVEAEWSNFLKVTVARYQLPLQTALTRCIPRGRDVLLDTDDLARPDASVRWANWKIAAEIKAMTIPEIRQEERLGPLPEDSADEEGEAA